MYIKVYVSNLGAYNRGQLKGEWLELPMSNDEIQKAIQRILKTKFMDEEVFISDYEAPFEISEYTDIYALNQLAETLSNVDENETVINLIANDVLGSGYDKSELAKVLSEHEYSVVEGVWDEQDLALKADGELLPFDYSIVKDTGIDNYLDWDAIGRAMVLDGWIIKNGLGVRVYI